MRFQHAVFQGPRQVETTTESKIDPHTGKTIDAWRVHAEVERPGLVASRRRFVGSPDSEIISGGINMKGDRGVPLVREGNMFLWGFHGPPSTMTEPGQALFVNVVAWMEGFDGQRPTRRAGVTKRDRWSPIVASPYIEGREKLARYFSPEIVEACGDDKDAYKSLLGDNEAYLHVPHGTSRLHIDRDAKAMGFPTDSIELIRAALAAGDERGERVLARYWPEDDLAEPHPKSAAELDALLDRLRFSEGAGYRWITRPALAGPEPWEIDDVVSAMELAEPSELAPAIVGVGVVAAYNGEEYASDSRLGLATVVVEGRILEGWHVTTSAGTSKMPALDLTLDLAAGCQAWGAPRLEMTGSHRDPETGAVEASGRFRLCQDVWLTCEDGTHEIAGAVRFQACDPTRCLPPRTLEFSRELRVR